MASAPQGAHDLALARYRRATPARRWTKGGGPCPAPLVRVFGLRRSGNHAVVDWLLRNLPVDAGLFLNNCARRKDPFASHQGLVARRVGTVVPTGGRAAEEVMAALGPSPALILSYEDIVPQSAAGRPVVSAGIDDAAFDHEILVYRSFLNWAASLTRKLAANPSVDLFQRHITLLRAFRTYAKALERVLEGPADVLPLCYDAWFADPGYREAVLAALGWPARDNALGPVQRYGGGSSFGETGEGAALDTHRRAEAMADDEDFRILMRLAARNTAFVIRLGQVFPEDAARLAPLSEVEDIFARKEGDPFPWSR